MIDHRKLGRELDLFDSDPLIGAGLPFWLPAGAAARYEVESYLRESSNAGPATSTSIRRRSARRSSTSDPGTWITSPTTCSRRWRCPRTTRWCCGRRCARTTR